MLKLYIDLSDSLDKGIRNLEISPEPLNVKAVESHGNGGMKRAEAEVFENGIYRIRAFDDEGNLSEQSIEVKSIMKRQAAMATDSYKYKVSFRPEKVRSSELPKEEPLPERQEGLSQNRPKETKPQKQNYSPEYKRFIRNGSGDCAEENADSGDRFDLEGEKKLAGFSAIEDSAAAEYLKKVLGLDGENEGEELVYNALTGKMERKSEANKRNKKAVGVGIAVFLAGIMLFATVKPMSFILSKLKLNFKK